jgi:hypothetical protein
MDIERLIMDRRKKLTTLLLTLILLFMAVTAIFAQWIENGTAICTSQYDLRSPLIASENRKGAVIVWDDSGYKAQRVNAFGDPLWDPNGISIVSGNARDHFVLPDGSGGAVIVMSLHHGRYFEIHAQRVAQNGQILWGPRGRDISLPAGDQHAPRAVSDGAGGYILAWHDERNADLDIYAQRIDSDGDLLWGEVGSSLCTEPGDQQAVRMMPDGSGGAIVVWQDGRNADTDLYAQRIGSDGIALWAAGGLALCAESESQILVSMMADGAGGAIVAWQDERGSDSDIYAQRIDGSGAAMWGAGGIAVCDLVGNQRNPSICTDGFGGAYMAWTDYRNGEADLYAQRVNGEGAAIWPAGGSPLCAESGDQLYPQIIYDGEGNAIFAWQDYRGTSSDIYAQKIIGTGKASWTPNGVAVCNADGNQRLPKITHDGNGGAIIVWEDLRNGSIDIYAQRINSNGDPVIRFLQQYSAHLEGSAITVKWSMAGVEINPHYFVLRSTGNGSYRPVFPNISDKGNSCNFTDETCESGVTYTYRVEIMSGWKRLMLFETPPVHVPSEPDIHCGAHPNPFNPSTTINYDLDKRCHVSLDIYDVAGRKVAGLVNAVQEAGSYSVIWDGRNTNGSRVVSGTYFFRITAGETTTSKKLVLLR